MKELKDYSGDLKIDLKYEDFSKDFLIELLKLYAWAYHELTFIHGGWVAEKLGREEEISHQLAAWLNVAKRILPKVMEVTKIEATDVLSNLKVWQIEPAGHIDGLYDVTIDPVSKDHAIATYHRCEPFLNWEKTGADFDMCTRIEPAIFQAYSDAVMPGVKVTPLRLGARKSPDEPCCQWEFKREPL